MSNTLIQVWISIETDLTAAFPPLCQLVDRRWGGRVSPSLYQKDLVRNDDHVCIEKLQNNKIAFTGYIILCLEHLDIIVKPVTQIKKTITIKYNATWTKDFISSLHTLAKGGEECTGQLEHSNAMVSMV